MEFNEINMKGSNRKVKKKKVGWFSLPYLTRKEALQIKG